jgi:hypothetical protein
MRANVEILVPEPASAGVKRALRSLRSTRIATEPSGGKVRRLVVASLDRLDTANGRRALERLCDATSGDVTLVFAAIGGEGPQSQAGLQALAHWSRRSAREPFVASSPEVLRRFVLARQSGAERELIATAAVENDRLVVWSCEPVRYEVPIADVPALRRLTAAEAARVTVSPSGSRLHWPDRDVDLDLDAVRQYGDPAVRRQREAAGRKDAAKFGAAIRRLRLERGLRQSDVRGLSGRQVRRLEEGGTIPHSATLRKLAAAHSMGIEEYLGELAKRSGNPNARAGRHDRPAGRRARTRPEGPAGRVAARP